MANLERCKAQQTIHLGNYEPTDYEGVHELYLRAYGNRELAARAKSQAAAAYADRKVAEARAARMR